MNEQRTNKGKIQKTKKMLRSKGNQAKPKLAESEQRESEQIKIKNGNGKLGIVGDKRKFKLETGEEVEGILQNDGLFHISMARKERIIIIISDGEQDNELSLQTIKFNKDKTTEVTTEQDRAGKILSLKDKLKDNKDVIVIDMRTNKPKDNYDVLEVSHLINTTNILNTEFKADKEVIFTDKNENKIAISFGRDFNTNHIDLEYYETLIDLCNKNKDKSCFTLNEFIRAHTGKERNEDIRRINKEDFYKKLVNLSLTKGRIRVEGEILTEWCNRKKDKLNSESVSILGREKIYDVFPCDFIDYTKHPNANEKEAVFYFDSNAFITSPLYLFFKGMQQWVTIPQRLKLLGEKVRFSDENQVIHNTIIRIIKSYDVTQNCTLEHRDFARVMKKEFKTRTERARFFGKLKLILDSIQKRSNFKTAPYFYFDGAILKFNKTQYQKDKEK